MEKGNTDNEINEDLMPVSEDSERASRKTRIPFGKYLDALAIMSGENKRIRPVELSKEIDVTPHEALRIIRRVKKLRKYGSELLVIMLGVGLAVGVFSVAAAVIYFIGFGVFCLAAIFGRGGSRN